MGFHKEYGKYVRLGNILTLSFLVLNDIFYYSVVEAAFTPSILPFGVGEYFRNGAAVREARTPLGNGNAPHKSSAGSTLGKFNKVFMLVVAALIITAICIKAKPAVKAKNLKQFKKDLAEVKTLARLLKEQYLYYLDFYALKARAEYAEAEWDALNASSIQKYKDEFFRGTDEKEKKRKEEIWQLYLLPFLSDCDLRSMRQSGRITRFIDIKFRNMGYKGEDFKNFDVYSNETPVIDEDALSKFKDSLGEARRQEIIGVEYFLKTYKNFYAIRRKYMEAKQKLFDSIKEYHKDVGRLEGEFAKKVNDESIK